MNKQLLLVLVLTIIHATVANVLKVSVLNAPPFTYVESNGTRGFLVDMWKRIAEWNDLEYTLQPVADGKYGQYDNATSTWTGVIGDVHAQRAHVALAPLTVSLPRLSAVAFTRSYMNAGIVPVIRRPAAGQRLPYTTLQQLIDSNPKVGAIAHGSTWRYFADNEVPLYKRIGQLLEAQKPTSAVSGHEDAVAKLRANQLDVIFLEKPMAYFVENQTPCDVIVFGRPISSVEYAIAVDKSNTELLEKIDKSLVRMAAVGYDELYYSRYWINHCATTTGSV